MAGLEGADRAVIESLLGPLENGQAVGQLEDLQARIARLVVPELVALEVLSIRLAELSLATAKFSADDVRLDHTNNVVWVESLIAGLVRTIRADPLITLNAEGEKLVARAESPDENEARTITITAANRRRG